jgi:hypothetical protein
LQNGRRTATAGEAQKWVRFVKAGRGNGWINKLGLFFETKPIAQRRH